MLESRVGDTLHGPGDPRMAAYFDRQHHPQQAKRPRTGYVAMQGDVVIGYIAGHLTQRHGCDGEVQYLYVAPDYRRQGVAAALLRLMAEWFVGRDAPKVCVNVDVESPGATQFYESQGAVAISKYWYVWNDISTVAKQIR